MQISINWKQSPKYSKDVQSQKAYREKVKLAAENNASVVNYVAEYFPWILEAHKLQKEAEQEVITSSGVFSSYTLYLQFFFYLFIYFF